MGGPEQDPPWIGSSGREQTLSEVEAILVQGNWPPPEDQVWRLSTLTVAVRIQMKQRKRRKKLRSTLPQGWLEEHKYVLVHHDVVGVTNREFSSRNMDNELHSCYRADHATKRVREVGGGSG
jgi:hypothetical protein